jgi:AcrR family transcriptional regulator
LNIASRKSRKPRRPSKAKQRLDESAYKLFVAKGVSAVGIDELITHSGVARMTLYRNYKSKDDLILTFLDLHEKRWAVEWLASEVTQRTTDPIRRLLTIFDLFDEWFQESGFRGCPLIKTLIESKFGGPAHRAAAQKLSNIRSLVEGWARDANLVGASDFAKMWKLLMRGSIIAAHEGELDSGATAKRAAMLILQSWPRQKSARKKPPKKKQG